MIQCGSTSDVISIWNRCLIHFTGYNLMVQVEIVYKNTNLENYSLLVLIKKISFPD